MFVVRLVIGLLKGLILGALVGYGLIAAGLPFESALIAYPAAAVVGLLVALVAGKPIWAKDARVEVGMKAGAGALLAPGLLALARHFLTFEIPFNLSSVPGLEAVKGTPVVGMFAVTSLAAVAAILAAFYDADNQPVPVDDKQAKAAPGKPQRVAASPATQAEAPALEEEEEDAAPKEERK